MTESSGKKSGSLLVIAVETTISRYPDLKYEVVNLRSDSALVLTRREYVHFPPRFLMGETEPEHSGTYFPLEEEEEEEGSAITIKEEPLDLKDAPEEDDIPSRSTNYPSEYSAMDKSVTERRLLNVTFDPVRIVISCQTTRASLQVFQQEVDFLCPVFYFNQRRQSWQFDLKFDDMLNKLSDRHGYEVCCGLPIEDTLKESDPRKTPEDVIFTQHPYPRARSKDCQRVGQRKIEKAGKLGRIYHPGERCEQCRNWLRKRKSAEYNARQRGIRRKNYEKPYIPPASYSLLTPREMHQRHSDKMEREILKKTVEELRTKLNHVTRESMDLKEKLANLTRNETEMIVPY